MFSIGIVGLGKMGANIARRLSREDFKLVLFDQHTETTKNLAREIGAMPANSLNDLVNALPKPRRIWLMLPSGEPTQSTINSLTTILHPNDLLIDGGNSFYKDSLQRGKVLKSNGIEYVDAGVSGGIWGEKNGFALMLGGSKESIQILKPVFQALAPGRDQGWLHCGPIGSGHYVKMVHNGIEYGMMQAYAEGLSLLKHKTEFDLNLPAITEMWRHGSVVRSWLLDLISEFLKDGDALSNLAPFVADSGEGRWTALEGIEQGIPLPVITQALINRFNSQGKDDFAAKLLSLMRKGFGGHATKTKQ